MAQTFEAKYGGACASPACDRRIAAGDHVVFVDQELFHDECALDSGAPACCAALKMPRSEAL